MAPEKNSKEWIQNMQTKVSIKLGYLQSSAFDLDGPKTRI